MAFFDFLKPLMVKAPELTYFNHLVGEFESLETTMAAEPAAAAGDEGAHMPAASRRVFAEATKKVEAIKAKRQEGTIDWNDLYLFEMLLADLRPVGSLRSKVLSLRRDYRSVAGQVEYDEYLASKPKNLLDPPDPRDPPDKEANYEVLLRDDLKDVLGRLFKRYAILPVREARLKRLTVYASLFCALFLLILIWFIVSMDEPKPDPQRGGGNSNVASGTNANATATPTATPAAPRGADGNRQPYVPSIALFVVLVSGAMGGFVSALQRIQTSPTEGDSIYNLAMLYHSSYAVFVAPLTGAIFAILLYMMFTGKILEGRFFPDIYTPSAFTTAATPTPSPTPTPTPSPTPTANLKQTPKQTPTPRPTPTPSPTPTPTPTPTPSPTPTPAATATPAPTPTPRQVPTMSLRVKDFLYDSGPAGGQDYALLIIWCFIAGFAERFVPDSLNRLINK